MLKIATQPVVPLSKNIYKNSKGDIAIAIRVKELGSCQRTDDPLKDGREIYMKKFNTQT